MHFLHAHLASEAIVQADNGQAEMQQVGDDREERRLLAAMLGGGRGEGPADLAVERAAGSRGAMLFRPELRYPVCLTPPDLAVGQK